MQLVTCGGNVFSRLVASLADAKAPSSSSAREFQGSGPALSPSMLSERRGLMFEPPVALALVLVQLCDPEPGSHSAAIRGSSRIIRRRLELQSSSCKPQPRRAGRSLPAAPAQPPGSAKSPPPSNYPILDKTARFSKPPPALDVVTSLRAWPKSTSLSFPVESPGASTHSRQSQVPSCGFPLPGKGLLLHEALV